MNKKSYNLKKLNEISQGDHEFVRDMLATFIENVTNDVSCIQQLKLTEDWNTIGETAHKLASNFAYLGVDRLKEMAANIEKSVIIDNDLTYISEKTEALCSEGISLVDEIKNDFF